MVVEGGVAAAGAGPAALAVTIGSGRRAARLQARQASQLFQLNYQQDMQGIQQVLIVHG